MTTLTGSGCSRSPSHGFLSLEAAWAAHIDEDFQAERWGADAEAVARREASWREFEAAGVAVAVGPAL
jgi:chaperone required for assembly of F1-ATPase